MGAVGLYVIYLFSSIRKQQLTVTIYYSVLSLGYSPPLRLECLILCELMAMGQRFSAAAATRFVGGSIKRRDIWPSREEAYTSLKARPAWKVWDDRVLKIFVVSAVYRLTHIYNKILSYIERWHAIPAYCRLS